MATGSLTQNARSLWSILSRSFCKQQQQSPLRLLYTTPTRELPLNRSRGVSALRRKPFKGPLSVSSRKFPLPEPMLDAEKHSKPIVDEDHGLWGFFNKERECFPTPVEDDKHGRAWTVWELRAKSWDDLYRLWWTCVKERNIISTQMYERKRLEAGYGEAEGEERDEIIRHTQRAIKHVLTERFYAWEDSVNRSWVVKNPAVRSKTKLIQGSPPTTPEKQAASKKRAEEWMIIQRSMRSRKLRRALLATPGMKHLARPKPKPKQVTSTSKT